MWHSDRVDPDGRAETALAVGGLVLGVRSLTSALAAAGAGVLLAVFRESPIALISVRGGLVRAARCFAGRARPSRAAADAARSLARDDTSPNKEATEIQRLGARAVSDQTRSPAGPGATTCPDGPVGSTLVAVRTRRCAVWDMIPRKVVVGVETSDCLPALQAAAQEAARRRCGVHLLHVLHRSTPAIRGSRSSS